MALEVYFKADIEQAVIAGVVLTVETAQAQGMNDVSFIKGALAQAKSLALHFGVPWPVIVQGAWESLGARFITQIEEVGQNT